MKQTNISVFVPHIGCPHRCTFCDQRTISGEVKAPTADDVRKTLAEQLPSLRERGMTAETAFFGGSFTGIDRGYMVSLLDAANEFVQSDPDVYTGIRCSTRPDFIDDEVLDILCSHGMTAVELGAQSMNDEVLRLNERGHTAKDVETAAKLIKQRGLKLGLQMMTGLYGDRPEYCVGTAERFIKLNADTVRIYPTVILDGTRLGELYKRGEYTTFSFDETVGLCAKLLRMFGEAGIPVIRLGLHASEDVERKKLGGVYHPALREICESRIFYEDMLAEMSRRNCTKFTVYTDPKNVSKVLGQKKENRSRLKERGFEFEINTEKGTYLRIENAF
ncbi:MAG: radical SAM protein [Oscillospiraceae bacterium]|nr:radical SAM protein [Oscillospiraceae bacterium]